PNTLSELAEAWDDEVVRSLFWDCLCHQGTCYGATYAAVPHLLKIGQPEANRHQRLEIALFLGFVALCAFGRQQELTGICEDAPLRGLPDTLYEWDRKLDCFRSLVTLIDDPGRPASIYEKDVLLPRYKEILQIDPIDESDLEKIRIIRREFISALPKIRALCERAFFENLHDAYAPQYLLSGVAAADGLYVLARILSSGTDGQFRCPSCLWEHEYALFGDHVAIYADGAGVPGEDRAVLDFRAGSPSRADSF